MALRPDASTSYVPGNPPKRTRPASSVRSSVGASHHSPLISRRRASYAGLSVPSSRTRPTGCPEPGAVVGRPHHVIGGDRRVADERPVVAHDLVGLPRLAVGRRRPLVDLVVVEVDDLRRHQLAGHAACVSVHVQGQAEPGEPVEHLERPLLAPVALVHVALHPDRIDRDAGLEARPRSAIRSRPTGRSR